ncbi:tRNA 5-carboxymethoxyuridine methyltransferase [subsurface metagenome]
MGKLRIGVIEADMSSRQLNEEHKMEAEKAFIIQTQKLNPNLDKIHKHYDQVLSRYFNQDGSPKEEFFENVSCYNCGSTECTSEFTINRFRHVRCARCGMVYVTPRLKERILHDSYNEEDYNAVYRFKLIPALDYRRETIGRRKYRQIQSYFNKPGSVLDIGCGLGELLSVFDENGWSCLGVEFNQFAANFAREKFELNIVQKSILGFEPGEQSFDCVMLWGTLEHFTQPNKVLEKVYQLLRDGGLLVLEVPNSDSILVRYYEKFGGYIDRIIEGDRHIMLFSINALRQMTERCGFKLAHLQSNGLDIDTLLRLNNQTCDPQIITQVQYAIDEALCGDLLRGFWQK